MPAGCLCFLSFSGQQRIPTPFGTSFFRLRHRRSCPNRENLDCWPPNPRRKFISLSLCNKPVLVDGGKLSFSLDKWSGKKCYMISARELGIVWSDTPRYWRWTSHPESRFEEVAELLDVCWLEISGKLETRLLSPSTMYQACLVFKFTAEAYGFEHLPAEVTIGLEGGIASKQTVFIHNEREMSYLLEDRDYSIGEMDNAEDLMDYAAGESESYERESEYFEGESTADAEGEIRDSKRVSEDVDGQNKDLEGETTNTEGGNDETEEESDDAEVPDLEMNYYRYQRERHGWLEIEIGEFFCEGTEDGELKMRCLANGALHWKSGLRASPMI